MARHTHRRRRSISPRRTWVLKALGFRYSLSRDAYVLRLVGNRIGPVYQVGPPADTSEHTPDSTRMA